MITLYAKQKKRYRCMNRLLDSREGEGGMFWKNSMYIIYSETDHQPRWDAWDKCWGLVHWEDPEELGGEGSGRGDRDGDVTPWLIHVNVWQNPLKCCEVISLQLIKINEKKNSPSKNTGVGSHSLLQGIFLIQGSNLGLLHCRWILYHLSHQGSPK